MPIGSIDRNGGGSPGGAAHAAGWLARALLLDPAVPDPGAGCWGDARAMGLARLPILLGWRRTGGPFVAGTSEGTADPPLLAATLDLAESTADWTPARWDDAFRSFWANADRSLRDALAARLPLTEPWSLVGWCEAVWGTYAGEGNSAIALVAPTLASEVRSSLDWLGRRTDGAAGYAAEPLDPDGRRVRCSRVAGSLEAGALRPLPGELERSPVEGTADPFESVERVAYEAGATASWSRREWVRFRGPGGTVRVFPRRDAVWLQLVGADEGTLAGLRFRHGVPLERPGAGQGPPGAHLVLRDGAEVTAGVAAVLREWLRGSD